MISIRKLVRGRLARAIVTLVGRSGNTTSRTTGPNRVVSVTSSPVSKRTTITIEQERFLVVRERRDFEQKLEGDNYEHR